MKKMNSTKRRSMLIVLAFSVLGISATVLTNDKYFEIVKNVEIFTNVYKELNKNYVEEIDPGELMRIGIDAMVGSLDPYTNFISESQVESFRIENQGRYEGLGILVDIINKVPTITEVTEGGPAHTAGLRAADEILEINGTSVKDKSKVEVNQIMRGAPGTQLSLKVNRPGEVKSSTFDVSRDQFNVPNVPVAERLDGDIAYVSLTTFTFDASKNILKALDRLSKENKTPLAGVILDLRENGGGLLREAIDVSNIFIEQGKPIVSTKGKIRERDQSYSAMKKAWNTEIPLVVLIDNRSASASEIVSGVMQDYDRGVLIGQRTYGKGLVQNTQEVGYNSKVKLTTAKYYIPSGRCIQSVEYENGEPVDIADDERSKFKTTNGREVLDGGGVSPDVELKDEEKNHFVRALSKEHLPFKFVTEYVQNKPSIDSAELYSFTDYDAFVKYVNGTNFTYTSENEKLLKELKGKLVEQQLFDKYAPEMSAIQANLAKDKENNFTKNKDILARMIEEDIVGRYYFQRGKIRNNLNSDPEIKEAIAVIRDEARYKKLLAR